MMKTKLTCLAGAAALTAAQLSVAGTSPYFSPLTQSSAVATPNHVNELNSPWQAPAGVSQVKLTSMSEIEADINQSVIRVPGLSTGASMWDMVAFDDEGENIFIPHETFVGAGATRYNIASDTAEVIFAGDMGGLNGDWSADWGAFDPSTFTPNGTLLLAEEWSGEGRVMEILNPMDAPAFIEYRELTSIINVSHEGLRFSHDHKTLYFVDENNSGSVYKFVMTNTGDYTHGQIFVLAIDDFAGNPAENYNSATNTAAVRTGEATWIPVTDEDGNPLTTIDPFSNEGGSGARAGRLAVDELNATPYGRPEDMEIGKLKNGREVMYFAATSEKRVYSVEMKNGHKAMVRIFAGESETEKNVGFTPTTATLSSPDNLAQDALGNIYIIEDKPNGDDIGGDIWFARDTNTDGVAESLDHFLSIQVDGAEATGMIFNPAKPTQFVVAVQHPDSTNLDNIPGGHGDALWLFDVSKVVPPKCIKGYQKNRWRHHYKRVKTCSSTGDFNFINWLSARGYR